MMQIRVVNGQGVEVPIEQEAIELEEARGYRLLVASEGTVARVDLGGTLVAGDEAGFPFSTGHWVGDTTLSISTPLEHRILGVHVHSRQDKLPDDLWLNLLADLETWLPGISTGAEGGRKGEVGSIGATPQLRCEALNPLVPILERALRALLQAPREQLEIVGEEVPLRRVRRVDRSTMKWLGRHPDAAIWLDPWLSADLTTEPPLVPQKRKEVSLDHPANRYIAWLIFRVISNLRETSAELEAVVGKSGVSDEGALWCVARAEATERSASRLERLWRSCELRSIRREPISEAALQVILDDPIYLRVHRIGRKFLDPRFRLSESPSQTSAAVRPSYALYELWCFLELGRQFRASLPEFDWKELGLGKLIQLAGSGSGAVIEGTGPAGKLRIEFNAKFTGYIVRKGDSRWSLSRERRPDFVVTWKPKDGEGGWVALDAKYRAGKSNLEQAFESVHIYKDSLRYDGFGGKCQAAMLLAPSRTAGCEVWYSPDYLRDFDCGIFELRPRTRGGQELSDFVLRYLALGEFAN